MCGDSDPTPHVNNDDVSRDKGNALSEGIAGSDGQENLVQAGHSPRDLESFDGRTFEDVWPEVEGIARDAAPSSVDAAWQSIGDQLQTSVRNFESALTTLKTAGGWEGQTIDAAYDNAKQSTSEPFYIGTAALRGAALTRKFREVFNFVHDELVKDPAGEFGTMWERYQYDLGPTVMPIEGAPGQQESYSQPKSPEEIAEIKAHYNEYMRIVMNDSYKPGITAIYGGYPRFVLNDAPASPITIPGLPDQPGNTNHSPVNNPGSGGPSTGGPAVPSSGGGAPSYPSSSLPNSSSSNSSLPDKPELQAELIPDTQWGPFCPEPGTPDADQLDDLLSGQDAPGLGDESTLPAQAGALPTALGNGANQALNSAMGAAKPTTGAAGMGPVPKLAEGALDLGKKGAGAGAGGGPKGGGAGGGAGGGPSLAGVAKDLPARLAGLATAGIQAGEAATRAALGAVAAGTPAAGAPGAPGAAGQGAGGGANGKEHKVPKALRTVQNGNDIAGEADAVVAVIGEEQHDHAQGPKSPANR